jgi:predicted RNA-binding Zn-ribbon protein involved in translation (DUF1610 family)
MISNNCQAMLRNKKVVLAKHECQTCGVLIITDEIVKHKKKHYIKMLCPECEETFGTTFAEIKE